MPVELSNIPGRVEPQGFVHLIEIDATAVLA